MLIAQSSHGSLVDDLADVVAGDEMKHLCMEDLIDVEQDLGKEPIICGVKGCVRQIGSSICLDGQRQEVAR